MSRRGIRHVGVATAVATLGVFVPLPVTAVGAPRQITPTLEIRTQSPWVHDTDTFSVTVDINYASPDFELNLLVDSPIESRAELEDSFDPDNVGDHEFNNGRPLSEIGPNIQGLYTLSYPVGEGGIGLNATSTGGAYPATLQLADANGRPVAEVVTYLLLLPDTDVAVVPLSVGVVMDVGAGAPGLQPDGGTDIAPDESDAIRERMTVLSETPLIPLTVVPTPETLDALGLGTGPEGIDTLTQMDQDLTGRQVLYSPFVDLDVGALVNANLLAQVQPERDTGVRATDRWLPLSTKVDDIWTSEAPIDSAAARTLQELGIRQALVPSGSIERIIGYSRIRTPTSPVRLTTDGPMAVASDDALGQRLVSQDGTVDGQRFLAELMLIWQQTPDEERGIAVRIPASASIDTAMVAYGINGIQASPVLKPERLTDLMARTPLGGQEKPAVAELAARETPADDLNGLPPELTRATTTIDGLAGALADKPLIDSLHRSLMIAPGYSTPDDQRMQYVSRVDQERNNLANAISAPQGFTITLTARDGNIPLAIDNASDQEVKVKVRLSSSQLEFPAARSFDLTLRPGQTTRNIPVRTRTSGAFLMQVTITSPNGQVVFDQATFTIRSTAISGVGLVLSIGAGLFLLIWWARHWRTTRRAKKLVPEHAAGRRSLVR